MKTTVLLDADIPIFQMAAKNQKAFTWNEGDEVTITTNEFEYICDCLDEHVDDLAAKLKADRLIAVVSEPEREKNWRRGVLPTYKMKRSSTIAPVFRQKLTDYMVDKYESYLKPTLEGDDVLGILATNPKVITGKKIIVSIDKDMKTIPYRKFPDSENWLFNPNQDQRPRKQYLHDADWFWMFQTLTGDTTDDYKGLPRVGPVKARAILGDPEKGLDVNYWWPLVVAAYEDKGFTEEDALVQAQVARICRSEDFNYKTKEAIPWQGI